MAEEDKAILMFEWEGSSRKASVCFCAVEGEGQAAAHCSAQLLSKLVSLSLSMSPPVSLAVAFLSLSLSFGLDLLCLPESHWQWGYLCETKQATTLATVVTGMQRQYTDACQGQLENKWE